MAPTALSISILVAFNMRDDFHGGFQKFNPVSMLRFVVPFSRKCCLL
jgi:hypothetical protein